MSKLSKNIMFEVWFLYTAMVLGIGISLAVAMFQNKF